MSDDDGCEREYRTIDKHKWGEGPWQDEPDKIQFTDSDTGLPCLIRRSPELGILCGYVGVGPGHPLYDAEESEYVELDVHGGITHTGFCEEGADETTAICHVPAPDEPDHVFWFGFDTGHAYDLMPGMRAFLPDSALATFGTYRTIEYVRAECARLARQLAALVPG